MNLSLLRFIYMMPNVAGRTLPVRSASELTELFSLGLITGSFTHEDTRIVHCTDIHTTEKGRALLRDHDLDRFGYLKSDPEFERLQNEYTGKYQE